MESFTTKALELQRLAHQLLFFEEDASLYSDDFCRQNRTVLTLSDTLYSLWNTTRLSYAGRGCGSLSGSINGV